MTEFRKGDKVSVAGRKAKILGTSPISMEIHRLGLGRPDNEYLPNHLLVEYEDGDYGLVHKKSVEK